MDVKAEKAVFCVLFNIPKEYHASDLRSFFDQLTEKGVFHQFHYRHRPVALLTQENKEENGEPCSSSSSAQTTNSSSPDINDSDSCCAILLVSSRVLKRLTKAYHGHHWVSGSGTHHQRMCLIHSISVVKDVETDINLDPEFLVENLTLRNKLVMKLSELLSFKEMKSTDLMPQGNIGTPSQHFLTLINTCKLPTVLVKKLGLKFTKKPNDQSFSSVPFNYSLPAREQPINDNVENEHGPARTSTGVRILKHRQYIKHIKQKRMELNKQPIKSETPVQANDESDSEQWDITEQFYDDAGNYERNKEKLFEEKIELKWEKGGSGLVFYTDAQYWRKLEGDFDEQTADDWDVDMQEYDDIGTGDKDARDFIDMRRSNRLRDGVDQPSVFGQFEQYSKGVGSKILSSQGWIEGQGVGKFDHGRSQIIDEDGQHPRDKTGLGYHGEVVQRFVVKSKKRKDDEIRISTVYDDPEDFDEQDELNERKNPHNIKHRKVTRTGVNNP